MKYFSILLFLLSYSSYAFSFGGLKAIHGQDDRHDVASYPDQQFRALSKSVAGQVAKKSIYRSFFKKGFNNFRKQTLEDSRNLCTGEAFAKQNVLTSCTAFLVSEDTIITAGHCVKRKDACKKNVWVFDYLAGTKKIKMSNVYSCKKIIVRKYDIDTYENDYAIIKLDRKVVGRTPLTLDIDRTMVLGDDVIMIGHPTTLPMKITDNAQVLAVEPLWFSTNLDIFEGNSGSPVFDRATGSVVGIAVRATHGYTKVGRCYKHIVQRDDQAADIILKISEIEDIRNLL